VRSLGISAPSGRGGSLLEQILKRLPGIIGPRTGRRRRLLFPGHTNLKQRALIARILFCNALLYRLHALKPAPRIEISALFARMQFKPALGALPGGRHPGQNCAALRAS